LGLQKLRKMAKKKKRKSQVMGLLSLGLASGVGATAISSLPVTPESAAIRTSMTGGLSKLSTAFPPAFKLAGTGIVLKQTGRLIKTTRKLSKKKKRK